MRARDMSMTLVVLSSFAAKRSYQLPSGSRTERKERNAQMTHTAHVHTIYKGQRASMGYWQSANKYAVYLPEWRIRQTSASRLRPTRHGSRYRQTVCQLTKLAYMPHTAAD